MTKTYTDVDPLILKALPNPVKEAYEIRNEIPEFSFMGAAGQPDYGQIRLWFYPDKKIIELKSLKFYITHYRDIRISYERVINCIYDDLMAAYEPHRLRLEINFRPRGGISSHLVIDSDWDVRGGSDKLWQSHSKANLTETI
jgi:7-cyano-7-deazaguanine reductase